MVTALVSKEFCGLKLPWALILQMEEFWKMIFALCCAMYATLKLLRLCDTKSPAVDKVCFLYYFI